VEKSEFRNWHEKDPAELFDRIKCSGHKLTSWKRKLHPTDSRIFTSPGEQIALRITRTRASGGGESSSSALKESKATPLWITECQDMIEQLLNSFMNGVNNRVSFKCEYYECDKNQKRI
jgi:hypothetical protein